MYLLAPGLAGESLPPETYDSYSEKPTLCGLFHFLVILVVAANQVLLEIETTLNVSPEFEAEGGHLSAFFDGLPVDEPAVFFGQFFDCWLNNPAPAILEVFSVAFGCFHRMVEFGQLNLSPSGVDVLAQQFKQAPRIDRTQCRSLR